MDLKDKLRAIGVEPTEKVLGQIRAAAMTTGVGLEIAGDAFCETVMAGGGPTPSVWSEDLTLEELVSLVGGVTHVVALNRPQPHHITIVCHGGNEEAVRAVIEDRIAAGVTFDLVHWVTGQY